MFINLIKVQDEDGDSSEGTFDADDSDKANQSRKMSAATENPNADDSSKHQKEALDTSTSIYL